MQSLHGASTQSLHQESKPKPFDVVWCPIHSATPSYMYHCLFSSVTTMPVVPCEHGENVYINFNKESENVQIFIDGEEDTQKSELAGSCKFLFILHSRDVVIFKYIT